ncbi:MAG: hypothetical protein Q3988_00570 [Gemella sp.]|nr:hypothetical protein [Gemella sp.]
MLNTVWKENLISILDFKTPGQSPFGVDNELDYAFMRVKENIGVLFIWDKTVKKKGFFDRIEIPEGAKEITLQDGFLTEYKLVS